MTEQKEKENIEASEQVAPQAESASERPAAPRRRRTHRRPHQRRERNKEEGKMSVLGIRRVVKVGEGAKRLSFSACVVVGDMNGTVGIGLGKARDVNGAIVQATARARKMQIKVPVKKGTIPYDVTSKFCKSQVLLRYAPKGTGVKAGSVVRAICNCLGVNNIVTKVIGNRNFLNVAHATIDALSQFKGQRDSASAAE